MTPRPQTALWTAWGILWAFALWAYLWGVGTWRLEWRDGFALAPIGMGALVSAMILTRFAPASWKLGVIVLIVAIWLIPALDLLLRPGCANFESIELYRTEDGDLDTRCTKTADMTREGVMAIVGVVAASSLVGVLVRRRKAAKPDERSAEMPER